MAAQPLAGDGEEGERGATPEALLARLRGAELDLARGVDGLFASTAVA